MSSKIFVRLEAAAARRADLRRVTNALRLVNGAEDQLDGLTFDQYDRHCVIQIFKEGWRDQRRALTDFARAHCGARYLMVKDRTLSTEAHPQAVATEVWIDEAPAETVVTEYGLCFRVSFTEHLNTGLFLDMRANRARIAGMCAGRRVLNCFAYTCAFGVHARARGAAEVVNVDISRKSLDRGRENYALNALVPGRDEFTRAEAGAYLARTVKKKKYFDAVILDPPSFARHDGKIFSVKKDLARLTGTAIQSLSPGGLLFVAANLRDVTAAQLTAMLTAAAGDRSPREVRRLGPDQDFCSSRKDKAGGKDSHLAAVLACF